MIQCSSVGRNCLLRMVVTCWFVHGRYLVRLQSLFFCSFIHCCVHCCGLQISDVSLSFQLLSLSGLIVSSQSSLLDRRPMSWSPSSFAFQSSFYSSQHSIIFYVLMCSSLCGPHKTTFCFSGVVCSCFLYTNFL